MKALQSEEIVERKRLRYLFRNLKYKKQWFCIDFLPALFIFFINILRRKKWLIANPWKYFEVMGKFDLIHVHVFPVSFTGHVPPIVISNAAMVGDFLENVNGVSKFRANAMLMIERLLCSVFNMQETSLRHQKAHKIIVFSEYLKQRYLSNSTENKLVVIPIGIHSNSGKQKESTNKINIGFIARDFYAKGGEFLLDAYKEVYYQNKKLCLYIIGSGPLLSQQECDAYNIIWLNSVSREELFTCYFPLFDIFAYPTLADGLPLVVLEALSFDIPVLTSDILALPEMIGYGDAGEITKVKDADSITQAIRKMADKDYISEKKVKVKEFFRSKYELSVTTSQLGKTYRECL